MIWWLKSWILCYKLIKVRLANCRLLCMINLRPVSNCIYTSCLLHTFQSAWNNIIMKCSYVWLQLSFGLYKVQHISIAIKVLFDIRYFLCIRITIFINNIYYTLNHLLLSDLVAYNRTVCKIFAQPNFYYSSLIDTNVWLLHFKMISYFLRQNLVSYEALIVEMQYVWIRDVFDVCQSDRYFFDENSILVVCRTKFVLFVLLQVDSCNKVRIVMSQLEDFFVCVVGILVSWKSIMSFYMEIGLRQISPNWMCEVLFNEFPLIFDEILLRRLISHFYFEIN